MRAVNYFKKRFEFALKGNGSIKINQNDLDALNQIIEFYNDKYKNTQLEDALLLFYLLQNWKFENINNQEFKMVQKSENNRGIFALSDSMYLFRKIGSQLHPKSNIIEMITFELQLNQKMNRVPDEQLISEETVAKTLEKELEIAKTQFPFLKQLNGNSIVKFTYKQGLTEAQRKMLGLTPH